MLDELNDLSIRNTVDMLSLQEYICSINGISYLQREKFRIACLDNYLCSLVSLVSQHYSSFFFFFFEKSIIVVLVSPWRIKFSGLQFSLNRLGEMHNNKIWYMCESLQCALKNNVVSIWVKDEQKKERSASVTFRCETPSEVVP